MINETTSPRSLCLQTDILYDDSSQTNRAIDFKEKIASLEGLMLQVIIYAQKNLILNGWKACTGAILCLLRGKEGTFQDLIPEFHFHLAELAEQANIEY